MQAQEVDKIKDAFRLETLHIWLETISFCYVMRKAITAEMLAAVSRKLSSLQNFKEQNVLIVHTSNTLRERLIFSLQSELCKNITRLLL